MALNWLQVNTPSIHGITRYRCGLYILIEQTPDSWKGVKMGMWDSGAGLTLEQAKEECELHLITERLKGSTYRPHNSNRESNAIDTVWHRQGTTYLPPALIEKRVEAAEDTDDGDGSGGHS